MRNADEKPMALGSSGIGALALRFIFLLFFFPCSVSLGQQPASKQTQPVEAPQAAQPISDLKAVAEKMVYRTNAIRKSQGLDSLKSSTHLQAAALYFAKFMATKDEYGHKADGTNPSDRANKFGYQYCIVSENIAYQLRPSGYTADELAETFVEGWKDSPEHRENMLDPDIRETGVAIHYSADSGKYYAVQMFGRPKSDSIRIQVVNQSKQTVHYLLRKKEFDLEPRSMRAHELCRPSDLTFLGTKAGQEKGTALPTRSGDVFVIDDDGTQGVRIQREDSRP